MTKKIDPIPPVWTAKYILITNIIGKPLTRYRCEITPFLVDTYDTLEYATIALEMRHIIPLQHKPVISNYELYRFWYVIDIWSDYELTPLPREHQSPDKVEIIYNHCIYRMLRKRNGEYK